MSTAMIGVGVGVDAGVGGDGALLANGLAYEVDGTIYYDVSAFPGYGKLSGQKVEETHAGHRVEVESDKRDPADFALWKHAREDRLMKWPSPWGDGFPGWHIECSAMSLKHLGERFDVHTGGIDLKFPHHEDEIMLSLWDAAVIPIARTVERKVSFPFGQSVFGVARVP